jgi:transposase
MRKSIRYVGLDVHQQTVAIAVADAGRSPAQKLATVENEWHAILVSLAKLGRPETLRLCYEAGPTGYELARQLRDRGYHTIVVAPSLVPSVHKKIKTDRRDAATLAHFLRSGDLVEVSVPAAQTEAMRDLERARLDAKDAEKVARQVLMSFLLRHGRKWSGTTWTKAHLAWIRSQVFSEEAQRRVLAHYLRAVEQAEARTQAIVQDIEELVETWVLRPLVVAIEALRGFQLIGSVTAIAEIGNFSRFESARQFMAYLGLVPSEHTSGQSRRQGRITRTGNRHLRRLLVEAAWNYQRRGTSSKAIAKRRAQAPPEIQAIATKAEERLCRRFQRMIARGKKSVVVVTAIARELAGFVWAIAVAIERSGAVPNVDTRLANREPHELRELNAALEKYLPVVELAS